MRLNDQTRAVLERLINPERKDLIDLVNVPGVGTDLARVHIELMREQDEPLSASLLALEELLKRT